jgi:hypothetical protein
LDKTLRTLTILALSGPCAACSTAPANPANNVGTGGASVDLGSGGSLAAGGAVGAGGATGTGGAGTGGDATGAGGATGSGGAAPTFCDTHAAKTLPFRIITGGDYVPSGWFPQTGPNDMKAIPCPTGAVAFGGDGGVPVASTADAGPLRTFNSCQAVRYEQAAAGDTFAGINWVPNTAPATDASCFKGVTALEFWAAGTPGVTVNFGSQGITLPVVLSTTWTKYSIAVSDLELLTGGVQVALTVGFNPDPTVTGPGPVYLYYADPTFVGN